MICAPARERAHSPAGGGRSRGPRHGGYAAFLQNAGLFFRVDSQGLHPGLVCDAHSGHGVRNWVRAWDWERIDVEAERYRTRQKTFGETFGAATGVSDPRLQKNRIRKNGAGGDAATVAGYAGPGFHNWPSGHIPQDTAPKPLLRIRSTAKKTFGAAFGAATGVSDPRLQKNRIRKNGAGGDAATVAGYAGPGFHTRAPGHIDQTRDRKRHRSICPNGATHTSPGCQPWESHTRE
jgi:hypothetical protein